MLAVELTSLGSPISASYWTKTITTALVEVLHFEMKYFFKFYLVYLRNTLRASLVCSVPSP